MPEESFPIPDDSTVLTELASHFNLANYMTGFLEAPLDLLVSRQAVGHTGYEISRFHQIHSLVKTVHSDEETEDMDKRWRHRQERNIEGLLAILVYRKYPGYLSFDQSGYMCDPMPFPQVMGVARNYIQLGYRGNLYLSCGYTRGEYWENEASADFYLGGLRRHRPDQRIYNVGFRWENDNGLEKIRPALGYCRKHFRAP